MKCGRYCPLPDVVSATVGFKEMITTFVLRSPEAPRPYIAVWERSRRGRLFVRRLGTMVSWPRRPVTPTHRQVCLACHGAGPPVQHGIRGCLCRRPALLPPGAPRDTGAGRANDRHRQRARLPILVVNGDEPIRLGAQRAGEVPRGDRPSASRIGDFAGSEASAVLDEALAMVTRQGSRTYDAMDVYHAKGELRSCSRNLAPAGREVTRAAHHPESGSPSATSRETRGGSPAARGDLQLVH